VGVRDYRVRAAGAEDGSRIATVLRENGLSARAVLAAGTAYFIAEDAGGAALGVIGLELGGGAALRRSAAVLARFRGRAIGAALVRCALRVAREAGCSVVYCFSTGAGPYWQRFGFEEVPVPELVAALPDAPQVRGDAEACTLAGEIAWRVRLPEPC
jgi:N-acetylglutamate synthase-like GNAT family acetyltransferase